MIEQYIKIESGKKLGHDCSDRPPSPADTTYRDGSPQSRRKEIETLNMQVVQRQVRESLPSARDGCLIRCAGSGRLLTASGNFLDYGRFSHAWMVWQQDGGDDGELLLPSVGYEVVEWIAFF